MAAKIFHDFDIEDRGEDRRSLLPKTFRRLNTVRVSRSPSTWPGIIISVVLFTWWSWAVLSDMYSLDGTSFDREEPTYLDFDDVWITLTDPPKIL
jgi:hypothetical protein